MATRASLKFKMKTKGLDSLKRRLRSAENHVAKVGFWDDTSYDGTLSMASLAFLQEYGTWDERLPARPFFRIAINDSKFNDNDVRRNMRKAMQDILHDVQKVPAVMNNIGDGFASDVKSSINTLTDPPNKPSTIYAKGGDNPLVESGKMLMSVKSKVTKRSVDV